MHASTSSSEHFVTPDQLCVGLHVHLDLGWMDHPFTFSSFKIKTPEQIATLKKLGLQRIRYSPTKSDQKPTDKPVQTAPVEAQPATAPSAEDDAVYKAKRERLEKLEERKQKAVATEREFHTAAKSIKSINQNVFAQPDKVRDQAQALVKTIADSMMGSADVAIQLMSDKIGNEDVYYHSLNVALLAMMLGREMKLAPELIEEIGVGAIFHDIGELEIPERIVRKPEALTSAEQAVLQQHCGHGIEICKKMALSEAAMAVIAQHHEFSDGSGYPKKLSGEQITLASRVVAIVNNFDELCNPNNLARALTPHEALSLMYAQQRSRFDPAVMATFVRCMGVYPPGTIVGLSNGSLAIVVSVNSSRSLKPTVLVYDPAVPKKDAIIVDLEETEVLISKTLRPNQLPDAAFEYLSPRKRTTYSLSAEAGKG